MRNVLFVVASEELEIVTSLESASPLYCPDFGEERIALHAYSFPYKPADLFRYNAMRIM